jgi:hypothetical protein
VPSVEDAGHLADVGRAVVPERLSKWAVLNYLLMTVFEKESYLADA